MSNRTPLPIEGKRNRTRTRSFRESAVSPRLGVAAVTSRLCGGLLSAVLLVAGCHATAPSGPAEHHAPSHQPADLPAAVTRLGELHQEIVAGPSRPAGALDVFVEQGDILRWLPGLAADSDLAEEPWNRVADTSNALAVLHAGLLATPPDRRNAAYRTQAARWQQALDELTQVAELLQKSEDRS